MYKLTKITLICVLFLISIFTVSCSDKPSPETIDKPSPETIVEDFIQAASEGNITTMLNLSADKPRNNAEAFQFLVKYLEGVSTDDLIFQDQGNMNYGPNFHRYFVYQGSKNIAVVDVVQIGEQFYIDSATTSLWLDQ
jgi:hypothetical protein